MGPLIDQELEQVDSKHNELMNLNQKLVDSFQLYTRLMKDATTAVPYSAPQQSSYLQQQQQQATVGAYGASMGPPQQQAVNTSMYTTTSQQLPDPNNQVRNFIL